MKGTRCKNPKLQIALRRAGTKEVALPHTIEHIYIGDNIFDDDEAVWHEDIPEVGLKFFRLI